MSATFNPNALDVMVALKNTTEDMIGDKNSPMD